MPSSESASPSPLKRPSLGNRNSSTNSLSSSAKHQHKAHRPHVVGHRTSHGRNPSYGKNLNKLGRLQSGQNLAVEGPRPGHQRKRSSGHPVEPPSPKANIRRNISQISLPKSASQDELKKHHSTTSMPRNTSAGHLKRLGLAPFTSAKKEEKENTVGGFQLGDNSSEEEEAEWEDSSHSPATTRQGSTSSAARHGQNAGSLDIRRHSSPPIAAIKNQFKSTPSLSRTQQQKSTFVQPATNDTLPLIQQNPRSARAPPAVSSVSAFARPPSSATLKKDGAQVVTETGSGTNPASVDVAQFYNGSIGANGTPVTPEMATDDDDYDSPSSFLPHYHPQQSSAVTRGHLRSSSGLLSRPSNGALPSRTQQRLELQRREAMRSSSVTQESDGAEGPLVLRTRSRSRGGVRGGIDSKAAMRSYESANSQLEVIKRFRNPVVEALNRLRESGSFPEHSDKGSNVTKDRPMSRAGSRKSQSVKTIGTEKDHLPDNEGRQPTGVGSSRPSSRGRVRFQRQGSHDDIGLSRSHGEEDFEETGLENEDGDDVNAEEALLRRTWESREVYEAT